MPRYHTVKLCNALQNPGFTGFLAEGLGKPNFDVTFSSGITNLIAHYPSRLGKIIRNSQNIRAYYMLNHQIRCICMTVFWGLKLYLRNSKEPMLNI